MNKSAGSPNCCCTKGAERISSIKSEMCEIAGTETKTLCFLLIVHSIGISAERGSMNKTATFGEVVEVLHCHCDLSRTLLQPIQVVIQLAELSSSCPTSKGLAAVQ